MLGVELAESGLLPDPVIRFGIRRMLRRRLRELGDPDCRASRQAKAAFLEELQRSAIALAPDLPNQQHYELPASFFKRVLGRHLKYSCGLWPNGPADLDLAEERMLELTAQRARIEDGMRILDLGCGWGSLSVWIAERFPSCRLLAVSNSKVQREFILGRCDRRGLTNIEVRTADINHFEPERRFDRVVSVEMFEHLRNIPELLSRIARWLEPDGKLFVHIFCHREHAYPYESEGDGNWMGRHFFSGGMMPSDDLLPHFQRDLAVEARWRVNGLHYHKTCEAWLRKLDSQRDGILPILAHAYGEEAAQLWLQRWRLFFLGCSELFRYRGGNEWWVSHYRFALPGGGDR